MNSSRLASIVSILNFMICSSCTSEAMSKLELEKLISENLKPGSNQKEIVDFLDQQEWIYDFDMHNGRYQARNPDDDKLVNAAGRNQIYIYVNEKGEFARVEIDTIFNGL